MTNVQTLCRDPKNAPYIDAIIACPGGVYHPGNIAASIAGYFSPVIRVDILGEALVDLVVNGIRGGEGETKKMLWNKDLVALGRGVIKAKE